MFGSWLADRIADRGMTPETFATRVGAHRATVHWWISGASTPRPKSLIRIAAALELPLDVVANARWGRI